uniref:SS nuclear autoantigen 1 n=1 Tax=Podarcis muralis TaxID=64176 RepID=A0A670J4V2_PODMU
MTHQGAVLQGYNNELVKHIEDLYMQREEVSKQIREAEEEKTALTYEKILESSRMLLNVLKAETGNLDKTIMLNRNVTGDIQTLGLQQTQH